MQPGQFWQNESIAHPCWICLGTRAREDGDFVHCTSLHVANKKIVAAGGCWKSLLPRHPDKEMNASCRDRFHPSMRNYDKQGCARIGVRGSASIAVYERACTCSDLLEHRKRVPIGRYRHGLLYSGKAVTAVDGLNASALAFRDPTVASNWWPKISKEKNL